MPALLERPYPLEPSPLQHAWRALLFGVFVAIFLGVFKPFGLHSAAHIGWLAAIYGATCTAVMMLLNVALPRMLVRWFDEARWTVARELGWTLLNVAAIGLANGLVSVALGLVPLTGAMLGQFIALTVLIGLFPIALSVLLTEARRSRAFRADSSAINAGLGHAGPQAPPSPSDPEPPGLMLPAGSGAPLHIGLDDLLFARAADNYVEVHHRQGGQTRRTVLRTSLKAVSDALLPHGERFLRCHKSHLVDLHKVQRVSGNAQGLRLHLAGVEDPIPVSRQLTAAVRERLAGRP